MYRRPLLLILLALTLAGCYGGPGYYESDVYTQPVYTQPIYTGGGYAYDNGYRPYYQERRIYVAPQPRYYAPPPVPRYYQPGRPAGYGWGDNRYRGNPGYRNDPRQEYRGNPGRPGPSWGDGHGDGRGRGGPGNGPGRGGDGRGGRGGDGRGGGHR